MIHKILLIAAYVVFGLGTAWKIWTWFRHSVGPAGGRFSASQRFAAALKGVVLYDFQRETAGAHQGLLHGGCLPGEGVSRGPLPVVHAHEHLSRFRDACPYPCLRHYLVARFIRGTRPR